MDLALYIHIPFCLSKCSYCDFFSIPVSETATVSVAENTPATKSASCLEKYVDALCNEITFRLNDIDKANLKTVYIGGGTPSLLSKSQFSKIFGAIKDFCREDISNCEITVELNPDDICAELLETLASNGVNRISVGIQSMNDSVLKNVKRRAGREENLKALDCICKNWKGRFSVDSISALPLETVDSFEEGLKEVISFNPDHISLYSLTIEEETPLGKQLSSGQIDYDFDFADEMWLSGRELLEKNGYIQYEVSNFAREGFECKHNLFYWKHKPYIGCGSGGTGTVYNKDGSGFRWTNTVDIEKYIGFWEKEGTLDQLELPQKSTWDLVLSTQTGTRKQIQLPQLEEVVELEASKYEFFMMGLRKASGITEVEYKDAFGNALPEKFLRLAEKWEKEGLFEIYSKQEYGQTVKCFRMNRDGLLFLNRFLSELEL